MKLLFSLRTWPSLIGHGSLPKLPLENRFRIRGWMKFHLPPPLDGTSSSTNTKHIRIQHLFGQFFTRQWWWMNGVGGSQWKVTKVVPIVGKGLWNRVVHKFFNCLLTQQVWCYAPNIIWQFFARRGNLCPRKFFPVIQCLFDQPLNKTLKPLSGIRFFLRSGIMWIIWHQRNDLVFNNNKWPLEKTHEVVWGHLTWL